MSEQILFFVVDGLSCSSCAQSLESFLKEAEIEGIDTQQIGISAISNIARIGIKQNVKNKQALINNIIEKCKDLNKLTYIEDLQKVNSTKTSSKRDWLEAAINLSLGIALLILTVTNILPVAASMLGHLVWTIIGIGTFILMCASSSNIYLDAFKNLKKLQFNMNSLVSLGTASAFITSFIALFFPHIIIGHAMHFTSVLMILGIVKLDSAIKTYAKQKVDKHIVSIESIYNELIPKTALKQFIKNNEVNYEVVPLSIIKVGDVIKVGKNALIPTDGKIISEHSTEVEQQIITGESKPTNKTRHDIVHAGTKNISQSIEIQATKDGNKSTLLELLKELNQKSFTTSNQSEKINTISSYFVPTIIAIALTTFTSVVIASLVLA